MGRRSFGDKLCAPTIHYCSAWLSVAGGYGAPTMDFVELISLVLAATGFGLVVLTAWMWLS